MGQKLANTSGSRLLSTYPVESCTLKTPGKDNYKRHVSKQHP